MTTIVQAAYIVSALLFIMALAGPSKQETAKTGNAYGITGMALAIIATIGLALQNPPIGVPGTAGLIVLAMAIGAVIGVWRAKSVEMTGMPELIAILHSLVGAAAVLVGYNSFLTEGHVQGSLGNIHSVEVFLGVFIGAVTLTGSVVAFLKLSTRISSKPLMLPQRHKMNLAALLISAGLMVWFVISVSIVPLLIMTVIALALGWHLVASIGGGDMPVVISMLNSYSGWAAAAAHPEYELSIEMTTGMSPPPMDATRCQPSARAITVMISSGTMLPELTNQTISPAESSLAGRFILCRCGRVSGLDDIRVLSLRNATTEPVRVTAPMNTPRNTSTEWMLARAPSSPFSVRNEL